MLIVLAEKHFEFDLYYPHRSFIFTRLSLIGGRPRSSGSSLGTGNPASVGNVYTNIR